MPYLRRLAVALAVGGTVSTLLTAGAAAVTAPTVSGPIVSSEQHQNGAAIDWARVAAGGSGLALVEATDGTRYRNPWFGPDFYGARAAGLVRGSFAVGRPALPVAKTAVQQADFYLARLGAAVATDRTLPPVLDLETTGGLTPGQLVSWAQTFLLHVRSVTGRTPVLRTYQYFWLSALGDPDAFTRFPLWIATADPATSPPAVMATPPGWRPVAGLPAQATTVTVTADADGWAALQSGAASPWPDAAPGMPLAPLARGYSGSATVSWLPGDAGSSPITGYQITAEPGDLSLTVPGDVTSAVMPGLVNGTSYSLTVNAVNAVGPGEPSTTTASVTPVSTSGAAPSQVQVVSGPSSAYTTNRMAPASYVRNTAWRRTYPAPGVVLQEGQHRDARGRVRMHVLRVDVKNPHLRFGPLRRHVADRSKLSALAAQPRLVAGTNAGFFDLGSGAPLNPLVLGGSPVFGPGAVSAAVGIGPDGLLSAANIAASGTVSGPTDSVPLAGWNSAQAAEGVSVYSTRWGTRPVPMPRDAVSRYVSSGAVSSATGRNAAVSVNRLLLVARGRVAAGWLRALNIGDRVSVRVSLTSSSRTPFSLAYSVGLHLVSNGVAGTGFSCKRAERLPARTAIGWTAGRRQLLLVTIDNHPTAKARLHGVEPDQMARIMRDLGAVEAYMFDGGGSAEMIVRPHPGWRLSIRNYPSDGGIERKIPLGFGIFRR